MALKIKIGDYEGKRLHLVDVSAVARTKWYHMKDLSWVIDGKEVGTGAIFSVLSLLKDIPIESESDRVIFCFDFGGNNRKEDYEGYKSGRKSASSGYYNQINNLRDILFKCGYEVLGQTGFEADDFIVGSVKAYHDSYDHIFIYTNDKDMTSLVDDKVKYKSVLSKQNDITRENYEKALGIPYNTIVLNKATVGDSSDKIKGIPRFGPKRFEKFIQDVSKKYKLEEIREKNLEKEIILGYENFSDDQKGHALSSLRVVKHRLPNNYHFDEEDKSQKDLNLLLWHIKRYGMNSIIKSMEKRGVTFTSAI